jgi:hypothetical protein
MKTRSSLEICLPLVVFIAACTLSIPTLVIAAFWMTIGVVSLGHGAPEDFPKDGIGREWFRGGRAACLWFYHLAWWPWYIRASLRDLANRIGRLRTRRRGLPQDASAHSSGRRSHADRD